MKKKVFIIIFVCLILIIALIFLSKFSSNSKYYINKKLGFSFSYPENSKIEFEGNKPNATSLFSLELSNSDLTEKKKQNNVEFFDRKSEIFFILTINSGSNCPFKESELEHITVKKIEVASYKTNLIQGDTEQGGYKRSVCFEASDKTFWLLNSYSMDSSQIVKSNSQKLFDQILSSFKTL